MSEQVKKEVELNENQIVLFGEFNNLRMKDGTVKMEVSFDIPIDPEVLPKLSMNLGKPASIGIQLAQTELDV